MGRSGPVLDFERSRLRGLQYVDGLQEWGFAIEDALANVKRPFGGTRQMQDIVVICVNPAAFFRPPLRLP